MKIENKGYKVIFAGLAIITTLNVNSVCIATEAENKYNDLNNQLEDNKSQQAEIDSDISSYIDEIRDLESSISEYTAQIDELQSQIDTLNSNIEEYQSDLQNSAQLYNSAEDVYTTRLRAIYENGMPSVFEILVSSDGIGDFFSRLSVYTSVLEYDQSMIGNMKSQKEYVEYLKTEIEESKTTLDQLSYDIEKSASELESAKSEKESKVSALQSSKSTLEAAEETIREEIDEAEAEIKAEREKAQSIISSNSTTYFSGIFVWPTTSSIITAGFGTYYPYGYAVNHTGTDIGVSLGSSVYAAASGTVIVAKTVTTDPNGAKYKGYGNYIMIDHGTDSSGKNLCTLYGHLSTVNVSVGQTVAQGQVIGYSGNTGNSTGAHLHFEVRVNNTCVNPMSYFN